MSTEDKKTGLDPETETTAETKAPIDAETVEDAEIVAEITPEGEEVLPAEAVESDEPASESDDASVAESEADSEETAAEETPAEEELPEEQAEAVDEIDDVAGTVNEPENNAEPAPEPEPVPESPSEPAPAPVAAAPARAGGGMMSTVFGGVIAAIVGFGAAQFIAVDWLEMSGLGGDPVAGAIEGHSAELAALAARLDEVQAAATDTATLEAILAELSSELTTSVASLSAEVTTLSGQIGGVDTSVATRIASLDAILSETETELAAMTAGFDTIGDRLTGVGSDLQGVQTRLAEVDERLIAVEKRPLVESSDTARAAFEAYENQLDELRGILAAQRVDAEELEAGMTELSATAAAQMTAAREEAEDQILAVQSQTEKQLDAIRAEAAAQVAAAEAAAAEAEAQAEARAQQAVALASLAQVEAALNAGIPYEVALPALAEVTELPAVFTDNGASGIPTVLQLQESFTPLARTALDASIKGTLPDAPLNRIGAFLQSQTGVRSLEARDGDDPDAVLSRMTSAVSAGDLTNALSEAAALPEAGQAALSDWTAAAQARLDAEAALPALAATLNNS